MAYQTPEGSFEPRPASVGATSARLLGLTILGLIAVAGCEQANASADLDSGEIGGDPDGDGTQGTAAEVSDAPAPGWVRYELDWDWTGVTEDGVGGWEVTNDLGYRIRLTRAYAVTYSLQVVQCSVNEGSAWRLIRTLVDAINPISTAWAGHGDDDDVSAVFGIVEDLATPMTRTTEDARLSAGAYCQLHYLCARADDSVVQRPTDVDIERLSLVLEGTFTAPGTDAVIVFDAATSAGFGQLNEFSDVSSDVGVIVRVVRPLETLFDGVDFATASGDDIGRAVVRALVENADIGVRTSD